ncbi:MAG: hypothetical protein Q9162_005719 [Coniocarpon cinnabarinum]
MASERLKQQARFVVNSVRDRQYDNMRGLRSAVDFFTQLSDEYDHIKEGVWRLVAAVPLFTIYQLEGDESGTFRFLNVRDSNMEHCCLRVRAEHTTIAWQGRILGIKFDLAGSDRDRYRFLLYLVTIWTQRQRVKVQAEAHSRIADGAADGFADKGKRTNTTAASALFRCRKEKRLTRRTAKVYKPSPLGTNSVSVKDDEELERPANAVPNVGCT